MKDASKAGAIAVPAATFFVGAEAIRNNCGRTLIRNVAGACGVVDMSRRLEATPVTCLHVPRTSVSSEYLL